MRQLSVGMALCFLCGCSTAPLMQDSGFQTIPVGANISEVEAFYGEPYQVRTLPDGSHEYCYIQRIDCGTSQEVTEYTFTVCQGRIVGKNRREYGGSSLGICQ